jgi:hypothetical protein
MEPAHKRSGRPSTYSPAYCDQVVEWGKAGKSAAWMASKIGVNVHTLNNWQRAHPEFADAMSLAKTHSQAAWEDFGQAGMSMPGFSAGVWGKSMSCRFPNDWSDRTRTELTGPDGGPVQVVKIERVIVDPARDS